MRGLANAAVEGLLIYDGETISTVNDNFGFAIAHAEHGFALDSDAHYVDQFVYVDLALWMTRKAGIPTEHIVNWLPAAGVRKEFE